MRWKRADDPITGMRGHKCGEYAIKEVLEDSKYATADNRRKWAVTENGETVYFAVSLWDADVWCKKQATKKIKALFFKRLAEKGGMRDSEIMDFCDEMRHLYGNDVDVNPWQWYADKRAQFTNCEGCFFVQMYPDMYPCTDCSRRPDTRKDYYSKEKPEWFD